MPRLFVLDAMNLAYRAFHALRVRRSKTDDELRVEQAEEDRVAVAEGRPPRRADPFRWEPLKNSRGEATNAIYGFANTVLKIRREERPDYWALAWDGKGPTVRHARYPAYKATRKPTPDDMLSQIGVIRDMAEALALPVLEVPGAEADDVMATLARRGADAGFDIALVTSDKDMLQMVGDHVRLLSPVGRGEEYTWVDADAVRAKWGVPPEQMREVLALMGDSIDNIPGVPGIGEKTAVELISKFGTLEAMYDRLHEVTRPALRRKLVQNREAALMSRELVTVDTDCALPIEWEDLRLAPIRSEALGELARRYELVRLVKLAADDAAADDGRPAPARAPERRGRSYGDSEDDATDAAPETPAVATVPDDEDSIAAALPSVEVPPAPSDDDAEQASMIEWLESTAGSGSTTPYVGEPPMPIAARPPAAQGSLDLFAATAGPSLETLDQRLLEVRARSIHGVAILPVRSDSDPRGSRLVGFAVCARDGTTAYVPLAHAAGPNFATAQERLGPLLADSRTPKVGHDLKSMLHEFHGAGLPIEGLAFDLRLAAFLLDPMRDPSIEALARDALGVEIPPLDDPARPGRAKPEASSRPVGEVGERAEAIVATLFPLADALKAQLEARQQWSLYAELEHPLVPVLVDMERTGILIDRTVLRSMSERAATDIARLEQELYALAGEPLNLNSGQQLSKLLFEKLGLKAGRRTKTGFSTDQAVLEELAEKHAFPARLLEYRALTKLKSTYLDALPQVADPRDGRVHTTYHQAGAATGRLSSSDPNLQNIPIRSALGREIRRAFVAGPGNLLVGADYSQIELRIMAHLSGDPGLIEAFARGDDVHTSTARRVFGLGDAPVPPELRARAKIVNFGIMYGMGARSLSQQMGIGLQEAQEFIRSYFQAFSGVRETVDRLIGDARRRGYAETLFGRRLALPGLQSANGGERSLAERVAINMPIQGSAADLMKLAMIRVHRALKRSVASARLLLQVHDELLLECAVEDADGVARIVSAEMEGCVPLKVPLEVSVGRGPTWFDVH